MKTSGKGTPQQAYQMARANGWVTSVDSGLVSVVQDGELVCSTPFARRIPREN